MLGKQTSPQEFGKSRLRQLVCVQIGGLLHLPQPFDGRWRGNNPSDTQTGESHFRKAVDVNHQIRTVELFE